MNGPSSEPNTGSIAKEPSIVKIDAQVGLEEVAAIKVADFERTLIVRQDELRAALRTAEKELNELQESLPEEVEKETRAAYGLDAAEAVLKKVFGKSVDVTVVLAKDRSIVKVSIAANAELSFKGDASKALVK